MAREFLSLETAFLPPTGSPRPGDRVTWFQDALRLNGTLIGHRQDGRPCIQNDFGGFSEAMSFDHIRLEDPKRRIGPNWTRLPSGSVVVRPTEKELEQFRRLLTQRTPPGPKYIDLVTEIWARGFEVFAVGGTVRDIISGAETNDVDLVTTMPLVKLTPLVHSMYRRPRKLDGAAALNGHLRLGGEPGTGDPFIDICVFKHSLPGTAQAIFGSEFASDIAHRDFACNAMYFDPVNESLLDPSGLGISDAEKRSLNLVCNQDMRSAYHIGQMVIRFFKFSSRGFVGSEACCQTIAQVLVPSLQAIPSSFRVSYIRTQILSKFAPQEHVERFESFRTQFINFGASDVWNTFIEPLRGDILHES
jgi:hypothetical protein